jgi:hypothetical protein
MCHNRLKELIRANEFVGGRSSHNCLSRGKNQAGNYFPHYLLATFCMCETGNWLRGHIFKTGRQDETILHSNIVPLAAKDNAVRPGQIFLTRS